MPRKRRARKTRRLPEGLAEITLMERAYWHTHGPLIAVGDVSKPIVGYHLWPSWAAWAAFYGTVRGELYSARPWRRESSCSERLYEAIEAGADPEAVRVALRKEAIERDPRRSLAFNASDTSYQGVR